MMCFSCKGNVEQSTTTYMTEYNNSHIVIKNVPCTKCSQCGEEYINGVTFQKIEAILEKMKDIFAEFAVIDYNTAA